MRHVLPGQDGVEAAGRVKEVGFPVALAHAADYSSAAVNVQVVMVVRHPGEEVERGVVVHQLVAVVAEEKAGVIQTAQGDESVEYVRPAEEEVAGVVSAHGTACGHECLAIPALLGNDLVNDVMEPTLMLFNPPSGISFSIAPGLPVDAVHADQTYFPGLDVIGDAAHHSHILVVEKPSVLRRKHQDGLALVPIGLVFHLPAQCRAVSLYIIRQHSGAVLLYFFVDEADEFVFLLLGLQPHSVHLVAHCPGQYVRHPFAHDHCLAILSEYFPVAVYIPVNVSS